MEIRNLASLSTADIVQCLLTAFSNYFVQLPSGVDYWKNRFQAARVDYRFSFGMFDEDKLVGFIINGIDQHEGKLTAFNSGTGVLPEYRGKGIVDDLYAHAIPLFQQRGVEKCRLEVIQENNRAWKVYRRIGFKITRTITSWKGFLPEPTSSYNLRMVNFKEVLGKELYRSNLYSWDNMAEAVQLSEATKKTYFICDQQEKLKGYFIVADGGQVAQLYALEERDLSNVIKLLGSLSSEVKFVNVPQEREGLITTLEALGFENTVNQYEMEYFL